MTTTEPQVSPKALFELRQAAEILQVSPSTIVKWTAEGKIRAKIKRINGRRCWLGAELVRAWKALM